MASREEKKQKEFVATLEGLLKDPSNKKCADCGAAAPRWASASLGVFLCMRCAGIHRNVGVHVTFVRSVTLDKWNEDQVQTMVNMGNARAEAIYEAKIPVGYPKPNPNDSAAIEKWIRDKYERKRFMGDPNTPAPAKQQPPPAATQHQAPRPTAKVVSPQPIVRPNPTPAPAPVGNLLLPVAPAAQPQAQAPVPMVSLLGGPAIQQQHQQPQQHPQHQQHQQHQQLQQPQQQQPQQLQGLSFPTAEEQNAAKKASLLSMFDQNQQQQQQMQQQQMQQAAMLAYQQQQAYLQQLAAAAGGQPKMYYDARTGQPVMLPAGYGAYPGYGMGAPVPGMQVGVGPGAPAPHVATPPARQDQFATLFG